MWYTARMDWIDQVIIYAVLALIAAAAGVLLWIAYKDR
jgi:hypothetical protein